MMKIRYLFAFVLFSAFSSSLCAQYLRRNFDESGTTYVKAAVRANFWARYYATNPGTLMGREATNQITDFSIRRLRMNFESQITPKLFLYSNFGCNNINMVTQKSIRFDIMDMYVQYAFSPEFALGMGEIGWGASRGTMRSSKSMMGLDTPLFTLFTVNKNDDAARSLGMFAKGNVGKWNYVFTVKNPIKMSALPKENVVDYALVSNKQYSGYLKYDFWQTESNKTSYSGGAGTYIGAKKICNLAIGGVYQSEMMSELVGGKPKYYDYRNFSSELFIDTPISERNAAITAYLGYFYTDFGRNYVRNLGANDVADDSGGTSFNGSGNDFPMMGTGSTLFLQTGYLLPKSDKFKARIQPHMSIQHSNFDGLKQAMTVYDLGLNVFFKGHDRKLTLSYQNRPIFSKETTEVISRKGMLVLQFQVEIN
ncbi:porin [Capnocytophaga canimorsus]|uniref:porin n=1 Tax=Capnocytophaga canimorsus TaxID=28188 RepID=UPI0018E38AEC|nr:porin [Capnocytophaga canimorsus]